MHTFTFSWTRRDFLRSISIAGGAGLLGLRPVSAAEPPPETSTIRLIFDPKVPVLCVAPQYVAEEFLRMEGFTDIRYVPFSTPGSQAKTFANNQADISASIAPHWIVAIDSGLSTVVIGGLHAGCFEVFASERVRSIRELKGKRIAVFGLDPHIPQRLFLASVAAYIGLDPNRDLEWAAPKQSEWGRLLASGEIDAIPTFPPASYAIHAKKIGHVIFNTTTDDPWRHYFCCMIGARREFVEQYPVATKRVLRALLKANELCSQEPERSARFLVDKGYEPNYDYALRALQEVRYDAWHDYDPADAMRFYSLRLREAGIIQHTPQQIIDQGTDWRFFNELKRELKA